MQQFGQAREGRRVRRSRGTGTALGHGKVVQLLVRMLVVPGQWRRCLRVCCGTFLARHGAGRIAACGGTRGLRGGDSGGENVKSNDYTTTRRQANWVSICHVLH